MSNSAINNQRIWRIKHINEVNDLISEQDTVPTEFNERLFYRVQATPPVHKVGRGFVIN